MEQTELNKKIFDEIESFIDWNKDEDTVLWYDADGASNSIERLVLQHEIDLLNEVWKIYMTNDISIGTNFSNKITELQNQLNQLK